MEQLSEYYNNFNQNEDVVDSLNALDKGIGSLQAENYLENKGSKAKNIQD